jgi:hypothetical protein
MIGDVVEDIDVGGVFTGRRAPLRCSVFLGVQPISMWWIAQVLS